MISLEDYNSVRKRFRGGTTNVIIIITENVTYTVWIEQEKRFSMIDRGFNLTVNSE